MQKCTVVFTLNTSHNTNEIGSYSCSEYQIIDKDIINTNYIAEIIVSDNASDDLIKSEFEKKAKLGSIALAKNERNPSHACPFFCIDWRTFKKESTKINTTVDQYNEGIVFHDCITITDFLSMKITRSIELKDIQELMDCKDNYTFNIDLFYHGLLSNNAKSKFFHFFTIIEYLERSKNFKKYFVNDLLFTNEEINCIKNFAKLFENRKQNAIYANIYKTNMTRAEKLFYYFNELNFETIKTGVITIKDIKNIIKQRNELYHSSNIFDNNLVYEKLFPLVRELVIKELKEKR